MSVTPSRRQGYLLGGLLVALGAVAWWQFGGSSDSAPRPASRAGAPSNQAGRNARVETPDVVDVKLESLEQAVEELAESARNPFRFRPVAPPPPPPRPVVQAPPVVMAPPVPQGPPPPPPPPPIPLRYIGLLGAATQPDRVAVLADTRGTPIYGREGDIIDGRYRLLRISGESVDVAYLDGRGRQTFRLAAQ